MQRLQLKTVANLRPAELMADDVRGDFARQREGKSHGARIVTRALRLSIGGASGTGVGFRLKSGPEVARASRLRLFAMAPGRPVH